MIYKQWTISVNKYYLSERSCVERISENDLLNLDDKIMNNQYTNNINYTNYNDKNSFKNDIDIEKNDNEKNDIKKKKKPIEPVKPEQWECCQSGCSPCIFDKYYEELESYEEKLNEYLMQNLSDESDS